MAAWNWAVVLQVYLYLGVVAFASSGSLPQSLAALISLGTLVAVLVYQGFIACAALRIRFPAAMTIVLINLVIAIILNQVTSSFYAG